MMKQYLEDPGMFEVDVDRVRILWKSEREAKYLPMAGAFETEQVKQPKTDPNFSPKFSGYCLITEPSDHGRAA